MATSRAKERGNKMEYREWASCCTTNTSGNEHESVHEASSLVANVWVDGRIAVVTQHRNGQDKSTFPHARKYSAPLGLALPSISSKTKKVSRVKVYMFERELHEKPSIHRFKFANSMCKDADSNLSVQVMNCFDWDFSQFGTTLARIVACCADIFFFSEESECHRESRVLLCCSDNCGNGQSPMQKEIFTLMARSPLENRKFAELLCNISKIRIVLAAYALLTHK